MDSPVDLTMEHSGSDTDTDIEDIECDVCTEPLDSQELACGHHVHLHCIARSGQNSCPVCRREVTFTADDQAEYERVREANQEETRQREANESIALARQLQNTEEPQARQVRVTIMNTRYHITFRDVANGGVSADDLMLQLNLLVYNVSNHVQAFEIDERAWELYQLMTDMNRISATTGLSVQQLCSIIENNTF
jgi:hypothetical protein